jgi:YVTN family beta-propeller protein
MIGAFPLKVFLAGRVAIETNGVVIDEERFQGRQGRLFFAYLVAEQGRAVPRDELAEALWGRAPPASWDKSLTVIASKLRNVLADHGIDGASALTGAFGCYRLALPEGAWVDVIVAATSAQEAEEALAAGNLDEAKAAAALAASLVRQPFLPGEEGTWVEEKRRGLADIRGRALSALADAYLRSGDAPEAAKWAEQMIALEPFRETGYRRLMEAHVAAGNRGEALRVYEQCRTLLAEELGAYPSPETESIYRALLDAPSLAPPVKAKTEPAATLDGMETRVPAALPLRTRRPAALVLATAAALVVAAAIAVAVVDLTGTDSSGLLLAAPNSAAVIDEKSNLLVSNIPVGKGPTSIAAVKGAVWATSEEESSVMHIDPGSKNVQRIPVGGDPSRIAVGGDAVWVTNPLDGTVMRIDPGTNRVVQTIPVGVTPNGIVFAGGALWVTSADDRSLNKIDPVSGHVVKKIPTGAVGRGVAVGADTVWVTDESSRSVMRIDPVSRTVVTTVPVGNGPTGIAFGAGSVWVANSLDGTVMRIDPDTNTVTATAYIGEGLNNITADNAAVWASSESSRSIVRIDPETGNVAERIPIGNRPTGLAVSGNQVWVAVQPSGRGHRGGRLVIADGGPGFSIDPSFMNWVGTMRTLSTAYDGLVDDARRGGSEGTQIVPDLATSLPAITNGETTYAFQLRRGIRYSNGTLVKASDFVRSFERPFRGRSWLAQNFPLLVGADACKRRPRRCDLSQGVRTDDATGTIVFHLRRPDPDFLTNLIGWAPIPPGTPNRDLGTRPVPSTGPYMIESYVPKRSLTLVRNSYFRVWSRIATPEGFPDKIVIRLSSNARAHSARTAGLRAVERGQANLAFITPDTQPEELEARYPSRVHWHPEQATVFLFLNTRLPPFNDVRVRRAVNLAVDRAAVARSEGGRGSQATCQLRPPGTVGFRRYCPYTADPDRTGEWKAPDLTRARRLVAASGTKGMTVTVWTAPDYWVRSASSAASTLQKLGYRARLRIVKSLDALVAAEGREKTGELQAGIVGYYGLPRTPESLLTALTCDSIRTGKQNLNPSFLCDRKVDAEIARAQKIQITNPYAAVRTWAGIENQLVDLAPWVPLFTPWSGDLVSQRVGNYQYNPGWGILLDQLWVR